MSHGSEGAREADELAHNALYRKSPADHSGEVSRGGGRRLGAWKRDVRPETGGGQLSAGRAQRPAVPFWNRLAKAAFLGS